MSGRSLHTSMAKHLVPDNEKVSLVGFFVHLIEVVLIGKVEQHLKKKVEKIMRDRG